ncbi:T9SS type B sorting domain-containing protein [Flavobacterium sp. GT3R68]|uniref:T9SS type B sorting domain-containing protein n=1 Tax=Flavobacterium sp. GT3R68 TaxID=2594437 RepID=UPI000F862D87|nr:T9SS type B sorting domain-containing protein [Flavobacterium sp. GT3R68]RTY93642.1 T9SS type B sorting domain-containing protein [Flavobacterium sp. GSN2]TRW91637.1 T9SS type B sorting domain-containing protein [Flavobacterium sp. GT3R68]
MINFTRLAVITAFISVSSFLHLHAQSFKAPCNPPVVTSPIYLCQNTTATPIVVTPSAGGTLNWYGTNATGGTASPVAPTPNTAVVGTTNYYVSQTIAGCTESPRVAILIDVRADTGDAISIICTTSASSIFFDWGGITGHPTNAYNYSYTIQGGAAVTGNTDPSSFDVTGLSPGQSVTLTVTSVVGFPCIPPKSLTCTVPCGAMTVTPDFPEIAPFCSGSAPILDNTVASPNHITGTWNPPTITTSGNYVFTPNSALFPCAIPQTLNVTVTPKVAPTFTTTIPTTVCQNAPAPVLPTSSSNGITGTWSSINTAILGTTNYTFTPTPAQCTTAASYNYPITVVAVTAPDFPEIAPFCSDTAAPILNNPDTSPNGITGTWNPPAITTSGIYVFTPNPALFPCAATQPLNVTIIPTVAPTFTIPTTLCQNADPPILPTSSNTITGIWNPTSIDTATLGTTDYTFTPNPGQCTTEPTYVYQITVNQPIIIDFTTDVTDAFSENQIITVTTANAGNYLYQLDYGPLQTSNVFENVSFGSHTLTVYDANGCSPPKTRENVWVIDYPTYFTPNGDNYHDYWNITTLRNLTNPKIFIFDRYGKLLKQISPDGLGWDGTFIGQPLPSTDYWFTAEYTENNVSKTFKAHFSLKR